jgi:hypothetical protein
MAIDGTWKVTVQSPMGAQQADLTLVSSGDSLTGTAVAMAGKVDISNGKIAGDKATWSMAIQQPFPMTLDYDVIVSGDEMRGSVKAGAFGSFPVAGVRA